MPCTPKLLLTVSKEKTIHSPADSTRVPSKPEYGQNCNGCGYCCAAQACPAALEYISPEIVGACPALEYDGERFYCGLVRRPSLYMSLLNNWADEVLGSLFAQVIGIGVGCDTADPRSEQILCSPRLSEADQCDLF